jgi:hypothetical protein
VQQEAHPGWTDLIEILAFFHVKAESCKTVVRHQLLE